MNAERELPALAANSSSELAKWYTVLGNAPMREVLQTALGLPKSLSSIDIDQQVKVMKIRTEAAFGSSNVSQFREPAKMEALVRRFVLQSEIQGQAAANSPAANALALLRR